MRQNEPSLWPVSFPALHCTPSEPWPSPLQLQRLSPSVSRPSYTVRPSADPLSPLLVPHTILLPHPRVLRFPVCKLRQRPLYQASAKGWEQLPPHFGLGNPLPPHNMGSSLLAQFTLSIHALHSIWSSISFVSTSPSIRARQIKERIFSTSM